MNASKRRGADMAGQKLEGAKHWVEAMEKQLNAGSSYTFNAKWQLAT